MVMVIRRRKCSLHEVDTQVNLSLTRCVQVATDPTYIVCDAHVHHSLLTYVVIHVQAV